MKKLVAKKSGVAGTGVFADERIKAGERVLRMTGTRMTSKEADAWAKKNKVRNDDWFQVAEDEYLRLDTVPNFINHSCNPNVGIHGEDQVIALRTITKLEEIFYDYSTVVGSDAPDECSWSMRCKCGTTRCRSSIGNWETLPATRLSFYKKAKAFPKYILKQVLSLKSM